MRKKEILLNELEKAPESLVDEVLDFIRFLKSQNKDDNVNLAIISESSLKKDWLKPEEDEAWQSLQSIVL